MSAKALESPAGVSISQPVWNKQSITTGYLSLLQCFTLIILIYYCSIYQCY